MWKVLLLLACVASFTIVHCDDNVDTSNDDFDENDTSFRTIKSSSKKSQSSSSSSSSQSSSTLLLTPASKSLKSSKSSSSQSAVDSSESSSTNITDYTSKKRQTVDNDDDANATASDTSGSTDVDTTAQGSVDENASDSSLSQSGDDDNDSIGEYGSACKCGPNQVFSNCTNGGCDARNCSQAGKPVACVKLDPKNCIRGCVCQSGYLRTKKGICVPKNECNEGCGNDPNAHPGCGVNCGKTCAKTRICPRICKVDGCDCNDNYFFDSNVGKCVLQKECTPVCGLNEIYSSCINGGCGYKNCSQIGQPKLCVDPAPGYCIKGCICASGYLRAANGTCVLQEQCPKTGGCGGDPNAMPGCGFNCGKTCSTYKINKQLCPHIQCKPDKCDCKDGYALDKNVNKCVLIKDCTPQCGLNEVYSSCTNGGCGHRNCSQIGKPQVCIDRTPESCTKGCICASGYLRAENGTCIPQDQCPSGCGGDPNAKPGCGYNCGNTCSTYKINKQLLCPRIQCKPDKCDCKDGYVLDKNVNKCVLIKDCTPQCGLNEVYSSCTNGGCGHRNCSQVGKPQVCIDRTPESCTKGCICASGYLRAENGTCIPQDQCPSGCGGDPNAEPGCGYNCGNTCSTYKINKRLLCPRIPCKPDKCDCKKGYVLDKNVNKCVLIKDCTPQCGLNEIYSSCTNGGCGHRNCSQVGKPQICIDRTPESCTKGCICAKGYLRAKNGTCIPQDQCPASGCNGDPNAHPGCGVNCGRTCDTYKTKDVACILSCDVNGCDCDEGFVFDDVVKKCVLPKDCTKKDKCDKPNEVYDVCPAPCPPRRCDVDDRLIRCAAPPKPGDPECKPGCRCADGYARNATGTCVLRDQCEQPLTCDAPNELYDSCPAPCPGDSCDVNPAVVLCLPGPKYGDPACKPACRCIDGYARNSKNECVPRDQCPPPTNDQCPGQNEFLDTCISGCSNQSCADIGKVFHCPIQPAVCRTGCRCKQGFYRNADNVCVAESECPLTCDGPNQSYNLCPPPCPGDSCDVDPAVVCPPGPIYGDPACKPACRCFNGYARNSKNECVPKDQCRPKSTTQSPIITTTVQPNTTTGGDSGNALANLQAGVASFNGKFLYDRMKASKGQNIIASPYSVFCPMAQLALYTTGESLKQLLSVLNVSDKQSIRSSFPTLASSIDGQTSVNFSTAAKVYSALQFPLSDSFKRDSVNIVHADAQDIDFGKSTEAAATINAWVESKTNNRIKDLIKASDLSALTRLVLVNAIYFKGDWQYKFNKDNTKDADFYLSDGTTKKTKLMYQQAQFNYGVVPELNVTALEMFYKGKNFSMVIVLPNEKDGVYQTANNMQSPANFKKVMNSLSSQKVKVYIPPFEITTETDLTSILKQEGVTKIFDSKDSGLSGLLKTPEDVYVSKAIQKAFIKVDENGSEAAAANAVIVGVTSAFNPNPPKEIIFRCDRNFLFYLKFKDTVLFGGTVVNPN